MTGTAFLVFDVETVIDVPAASAFLALPDGDNASVRAALRDHQADKTGGRSDFPKPPFHQVIAISVLCGRTDGPPKDQRIQLQTLTSRSADAEGEGDLLRWFFGGFEQLRPQLVSFNGRGFDLPVLKYRAMRNFVSVPLLHDKSNKWENYAVRYASNWHCDLLEVLSDYGASPRVTLDEICTVLGMPGKVGIDGSQVEQMYDEGRLSEVAGYCETDVLNTYLLFLRWQHHQGRLTSDGYNAAISALRNYISNEAGTRAHLEPFAAIGS
jgi:predicted PolB exonuclease-like 3'-5' exonuclease